MCVQLQFAAGESYFFRLELAEGAVIERGEQQQKEKRLCQYRDHAKRPLVQAVRMFLHRRVNVTFA